MYYSCTEVHISEVTDADCECFLQTQRRWGRKFTSESIHVEHGQQMLGWIRSSSEVPGVPTMIDGSNSASVVASCLLPPEPVLVHAMLPHGNATSRMSAAIAVPNWRRLPRPRVYRKYRPMSCGTESPAFDPLNISSGSCKRLQTAVQDALLRTGRWWFAQFLDSNFLLSADSVDTVHDLMHYTVFACLNPHVHGRSAATTLRCEHACMRIFALKQRQIQKPTLACKNELRVQQHFHDTCLVDSFRALGVRVPYERHGPFWALAEGNEMLKPFGKCLCPTSGFSTNGKYVVHENNHFLAVSVCDGEARVHMSKRPRETEYLSSTHGPWDCVYELQNISQLSGSTAATVEKVKSDLRGGSSRMPGFSMSDACRGSTRREKSVLVISWRWTNVLMVHPCLRKLLPDPSQADVSCRTWEAQLRLCRRVFFKFS